MKMAIISHPDCFKHSMIAGHPEAPERLQVIQEHLQQEQIKSAIDYVTAPKVTKELLYKVHSQRYIDDLFARSPRTGLLGLDPDTYMNPYTLAAALRAAGSVVQAVDLVLQKRYLRVFCNIRPPGHHATANQAMGFCFFNNVVIGALYALQFASIDRVAIVDFDVHQGNGTIDIIQEMPNIFYASFYQHPFYPFTNAPQTENFFDMPLAAYSTSDIVRKKFIDELLPRVNEFKPDIVFISAGFDAYYLDPLANLFLTDYDYYYLTKELVGVANRHAHGRVISVLEGGYKLPELGECVLAHCWGLLEKNITQLRKKIGDKVVPLGLVEWISLAQYKILLRPILPSDNALHRQFIALLEQKDIQYRFFGTVREFTEQELNKFVNIDYESEMSFVAINYGEAKTQVILGVVKICIDIKHNIAEFAIVIRSDFKQHGLGYQLMNKMIHYCRDRQLNEIHGEVLLDNQLMLELVTNLGFNKKANYEKAVVEISLPLK